MVTAYPIKGKQKSYDICKAFVDGCGGTISIRDVGGPAFFYGVDVSNMPIWHDVITMGRDFYYCDNSYFDSTRQEYFRVTKNRLQHPGLGESDCMRFNELGISIKPWRREGYHIVVCPQSDHFMQNIVGYAGNWTQDTLAALQKVTRRAVRLRMWSGDKGRLAGTLKEDLEGAHALVTWSSAAAISAIIEGVPAVVLGECAAAPVAAIRIKDIDCVPRPAREQWLGVLADNQWTLDEMRSGHTWEDMNAQ